MQNEAPTARNLLTSVTDSIPNPSLRLSVIMRMKPGSSKIVNAIAAAPLQNHNADYYEHSVCHCVLQN